MNTQSIQRPEYETIEEISKWTVGLGTITFALFPLALPILALTAVALLPLLIPVLAVGLLVAIVALPVRLLRGGLRRLHRRRGGPIEPARTARSA
jgi:hypothetical protein